MNIPQSLKRTCLSILLGLGLSAGATVMAHAADSAVSEAAEAVSDSWITAKVKAELATSKSIESSNISVTTNDGVVELEGQLQTQDEVDKVLTVVKNIDGVKGINSTRLKAID